MKTTATNKKLRVILSAIQSGALVPNPDFQRRLVWSSKHKNDFLRTVLNGYPFPEIYVAAGSVNPETAEGTEMLVDGQQRITTLFQYFKGSPELKLDDDVMSYAALKEDPEKLLAFLEYEVVVRDLGQVPKEQIIEVFKRINSTKYSLTAVEVHNARFEGAFKAFAENLAGSEFFERHRVFSAASIRRMGDLRFALTLAGTLLLTYFNRDDELESFLREYNDEFPHADWLSTRLDAAFAAVEAIELEPKSRAWSEVNLLPLLVEVDRAIREGGEVSGDALGRLRDFFDDLGALGDSASSLSTLGRYFAAQRYATADRGSRLRRGRIIKKVIDGLARPHWFDANEPSEDSA